MKDLSTYLSITESDYTAVAGPDWPSYENFQKQINIPDFVYREIDEMLSGPVAFDNPAFCVLPFYSLEIPSNVSCCLLPENTDVESIKQQMLQGQRPSACHKCWRLEDAGILSDRMLKNQTLDYYFDQDLHSIFEDCVQNKNQIQHYKIDTNNVCNATCVTCNSQSSSAWAQLERKNQQTPHKTWNITNQQVHSQIDYSTAKSITFRGGEPFLSSTNFYILEQLLAHNNHDCFISFVTNGSTKLNDYQKATISKFKNVNFCFSIDGVGPVFEYMRYPLKWSVLEQNLAYCRDNQIDVSASYTLSNLNVYYYDQTVDWFNSNQINFMTNPVYDPVHFQPTALSAHAKQHIVDRLRDPEIKTLLQNHSDADEQNYQQFRRAIKQQNLWKGISVQDYLPEVADLLDI